MQFAIIILTFVLGIATAHPEHGSYGQGPAKYDFGYGVQDAYSGANFGHSESRDGYKTSGSYYVDLPDGRTQKVSYTADEYGYHPVVTYSGQAHYQPQKSSPYAPKGYH